MVIAIHGFASSGLLNWHTSKWTRDLVAAGFRVIAIDQRGHGASNKPHDRRQYTMELLVDDVRQVLDSFMLHEVDLVGYSLGARVGWRAALEMPGRIRRVVLGGIPNGDPLVRFRLDQARDRIRDGTEGTDALTGIYLRMAEGVQGNDLTALVALVEGMRGGEQPDPADPPLQPILFATGSADPILEESRALAAAVAGSSFLEIPGRNHFTAPSARSFRTAATEFLRDETPAVLGTVAS